MNETKKCKHCQSEIDKKAKICPNCRKKQGGNAKFIILGVIVFFILIGTLGNKDDEPKKVSNTNDGQQQTAEVDNKSDDTEKAKTEEKTTFAIGETASLKDVLVTMNGVTEAEGGQFNTPTEGNVFVLCEFTIENESANDITVSSMLSFEAYADDFSINQSIKGLLEKGDKNQLDGSVAAGKKMNGVIAYEVPKDWKELEINFTPNFWGKEMTFKATK